MSQRRVAVAMSGGVDSSVAAALLLEQGYQVFGLTLHLWPHPAEASRRHPCCLTQDVDDARWVCHLLGIPYYVLNFEALFRRYVVEPFCSEYARGHTPNPCLACNQHIKFRFLLNRVLALGADYLATGHYARLESSDGQYCLLQGMDTGKDQSYVLYMLGQEELRHLLLPLGQLTKRQARLLAAQRGLPVADKPDSQEICFLPDGDYRPFLAQYVPALPGDIVDAAGRVLGRHTGIAGYTIGQRRGLGVSSEEPMYVQRIDAARNLLVVGGDAGLYSRHLRASSLHWVSGRYPSSGSQVQARIRYRSPAAPATLEVEEGGTQALVHFDQPQRAVAPGQAVVFYRGEEVLGGGLIQVAERDE